MYHTAGMRARGGEISAGGVFPEKEETHQEAGVRRRETPPQEKTEKRYGSFFAVLSFTFLVRIGSVGFHSRALPLRIAPGAVLHLYER